MNNMHMQPAQFSQLMQSLDNGSTENFFAALRPMLSDREQKFIDLIVKFQELRVLTDEVFGHNVTI